MTAVNYIALHGGETSFIVDATTGMRPSVIYWGPLLDGCDPADLKRMATRQRISRIFRPPKRRRLVQFVCRARG